MIDEPSLTLSHGVPSFVIGEETRVSQAPELFDCADGCISLADGYMTLLEARYESKDAMIAHAQSKIDELQLGDTADSEAYSIWLLVAMTI